MGKVRRPAPLRVEKSAGTLEKSSFAPDIAMKTRLSLLALCAGLGLAGCNQPNLALCPAGAILADTASHTLFRPGAPTDLSGEVLTARLTDFKTGCTFDKQAGSTYSDVTLSFRATRPPSADAAHYSLDYFITVSSEVRILDKKMYRVSFDFAPGATVATAEESPPRVTVNLERGHQPADYQLLAGFQLTEAELNYNRRMGRYLP